MSDQPLLNRRNLMLSGAALLTGTLVSSSSSRVLKARNRSMPASPSLTVAQSEISGPASLKPALFQKALAALDRHAGSILRRDRIAIIDFSAASSQRRFHFLDVANGRVSHRLVAHGSGSDPHHTGYLERFSNEAGSNASSEGAYVTSNYYVGKHGRSQRLRGLDPTNSNAFNRAIVVHGASYANIEVLQAHGKLGRSQGCFAVGEGDLGGVDKFSEAFLRSPV